VRTSRRSATAGAVAVLVVVLAVGAACGSSGPTSTTTSGTPTGSGSTPPSSSPAAGAPASGAPAASGAPPHVPTSGAYLGAWLHPAPRSGATASFAVEQQALPAVRAAVGRPLGILHVYVGWSAPAPVSSLSAISAAGSVPMLDWGCGPDVAAVAQGSADATVTAFARALRSYGGPVLLRWCWEMNLARAHPQIGSPSDFTSAWQHVRARFRAAGAANVSFVWCPALSGLDPAPYYPGDASVDWIGVDGYDRDGAQTFASLFGAFHATWVGHGKPMVVAETAAAGSSQPAFIASIGTGMPALAGFKAVVWFDAPGPALDWAFTPAGLQAFAQLARQPYFTPS